MFRKLSKNTLFLSFVSFFNDVASEMVYPIIPVFLTSVLGSSVVSLGVVEGGAEFFSNLLKLVSGYISDKVGRSKILVFSGYLVSSISRPVMGFSKRWFDLFVLRALDRSGKGLRTSPRDKIIFLSQDKSTLGFSFSFQRAMDHMGALVGPLVLFFLLSRLRVSLRSVFFISAIPSFFTILFILPVRDIESRDGFHDEPDRVSKLRPGRKFYIYMVSLFLFSLGNASDAFIVLLLMQRGFSIADVPLIWGFFSLTKGVSSPLFGFLSDRYGRKIFIVAGWMLYSFCYFLFPFQSGFYLFLLVGLYGTYYAMTEGVEKALLGEMVKSRAGSMYGIFHFVKGLSLLASSVIFSVLWRSFGAKYAFWTGGSLGFIAALLLMVV